MGKFCQFLTELSAPDTTMVRYYCFMFLFTVLDISLVKLVEPNWEPNLNELLLGRQKIQLMLLIPVFCFDCMPQLPKSPFHI